MASAKPQRDFNLISCDVVGAKVMRVLRLRNTEFYVRDTHVELPMPAVPYEPLSLQVPKLIQIIKARRTPSHNSIAYDRESN